MKDAPARIPIAAKLGLVARVWWGFLDAFVATKRRPLPQVVASFRASPVTARMRTDPRRLGKIIARLLAVGPFRARCLFTSLVLYRLLREQGDEPELVIGLPREPRDKDAHAWVEMDGVDVGPPPGRGLHEELARFG